MMSLEPTSFFKTMEKEAIQIVKKLHDEGFEAYFVGGCVRDRLLGQPSKDIDIATSATTKEIQKLFRRTIPVGVQFGVVRVRQTDFEFEVATFRADGEYLDGRRPEKVYFTTVEKDVLRRDFTINGLLYDPLNDRVLDFVQGELDLHARRIQTIGEAKQRFTEDKLRMIRAIRFACQLDFSITPETWDTLCQMSAEIRVVSQERIMEEWTKIFTSETPIKGFKLLRKSGLLQEILQKNCPSSEELDFSEKLLGFLKEDFSLSLEKVLAVLFFSFQEPRIYALKKTKLFGILDRLKFKHSIVKDVVALVQLQPKIVQVSVLESDLAFFKKTVRDPHFEEAGELYQASLRAESKSLDSFEALQERLEGVRPYLFPEPLLNGDDLVSLGYQPNELREKFKQILEELENEQLREKLSNRREAIAWLKETYPLPLS